MLKRTLNTPDNRATQLVLTLVLVVLIEEIDPLRSFCAHLEGVRQENPKGSS